jgi:hypothetical protein
MKSEIHRKRTGMIQKFILVYIKFESSEYEFPFRIIDMSDHHIGNIKEFRLLPRCQPLIHVFE